MNIITKLNIRQRVMLVLTILAAMFLAWQIYNFVHSNSATVSAPRPAVVTGAPAVQAPPALAPIPQVRPLPADLANPALNNHQQEYLNLVREYQVTKMKRQILEEEAGLANAQKRIADAGKNGPLPYIDTFGGDNLANSNSYRLTYLDRQAGQWTATLGINGQYIEVHTGSRLPDGSRVIVINSRGVVLQLASGKNLTVGFQGSVNVDNTTPSYAVNKGVVANKPVKPVVSNNPNNSQIAKMLGITSAPPAQATGALTAPVSHDMPAGPLTITVPPAPSAPTQPAAPASGNPNLGQPQQNQSQANPNQPANPNYPQQQTAAVPGSPPPSAVKPVSVKEMRQDIDQLSWQQSADQQGQDQ